MREGGREGGREGREGRGGEGRGGEDEQTGRRTNRQRKEEGGRGLNRETVGAVVM